MKEVLLTFAGTNDSYKDKDRAVLTVFKNQITGVEKKLT